MEVIERIASIPQHSAFLGMTGSGKTSSAKLLIEHVARRGDRVCVLDMLKSDWWGLTLDSDGKSQGLPFDIIGGPHGHVPLHSSAGTALGRLAATGDLRLSIIDMAQLEMGGQAKFFVDFAEALTQNMTGYLYLVIEEAHEIAPKERSGVGRENMALYWAKRLATAGRSLGIRLVVATQRVQSLHNAVLGSCDTLVAHRMTLPADQKPVVTWLEGNMSSERAAEVKGALAGLPTGTGFVCCSSLALFERVAFPRIRTYDNTATPTKDSSPVALPVYADKERLRAVIGDALKEAEANDPELLRAVIADLRKRIDGGRVAAPPEEIDAAERRGYEKGKKDGFAAGEKAGREAGRLEAGRAILGFAGEVAHLTEKLVLEGERLAPQNPVSPAPPKPTPAVTPKKLPATAPDARVATPPPAGLTGPQGKVLASMGWWKSVGVTAPDLAMVAVIAGWSPNSSNIRDRATELVRAGLLDRPIPGKLSLTDAGGRIAPEPPPTTFADAIRSVLTNPQRALFDALVDAGEPLTIPQAAARVGWSAESSNIRDRATELTRLTIAFRPQRGAIAISYWVREGLKTKGKRK